MRKGRWIRGAVWAAIVATTLFIWTQSTRSAATSLEQSESLNALLVWLFDDGYKNSFLYVYIRKAAHLAEFALLGAEWGVAQRWLGERWRWVALAAGPLTAACDEAIQVFSAGRSAQASDVLLDCVGYACGFAAVWAARWLWRKIRKKDGLG